MSGRQFETFRASALWCTQCVKTMSVREKLLLVLPTKELYEYLCSGCANSLGTREVTGTDKLLKQKLPNSPRRTQVRLL